MKNISYSELAVRHGKRHALNLLHAIERLALINDQVVSIDLEIRFQKAFEALCKIDFAM